MPGAKLLPDHRIAVDVLLLTGTNTNLDDPEERKRLGFRDDLHRDFGTPLFCPNLNERREDVPELVLHFVAQELKTPENPNPNVEIDKAVLDVLKQRNWSQRGNVADLERIAQHVASQPRITNKIKLHHLPEDIVETTDATAQASETKSLRVPEPVPASTPTLAPPSAASAPTQVMPSTPTISATPEMKPGALAFAELAHLRRRVELLEHFAEQTRKRDKATGLPGRYQPTEAVSRLLSAHISTQNSKRIIGEIVGTILDTPKYLADAYDGKGLDELREWTQNRSLLVNLYRYARGQISIDEVSRD